MKKTDIVPEKQPTRVRTWYGLPAEIVIGEDLWLRVSAGGLAYPHPGLVNRHLRQGHPVYGTPTDGASCGPDAEASAHPWAMG